MTTTGCACERITASAASRTFVSPISIDEVVQFTTMKLARPAWPEGPDGHVATVGCINPGSEPPGLAYGMS